MFLGIFKNIAFSKNWFEQFNYLFTFFLNNKKTAPYLREKLRLLDFDINVPIAKITPSSVHYEVSEDTFTAVCYSYDRIANLMKKEFENIFMLFHKFDEKIANQFLPILNLGYDTLTSYSSTADGIVTNLGGVGVSWATVRNASTGTSISNTDTNATNSMNAGNPSSRYSIVRSFFYFDTSSLTANAVVSDATLSLYGFTSSGAATTSVQKSTQADTLTTSDFGAISGSLYYNLTTWSSTGYNAYPFNATGIADISLASVTKICARQYNNDYSDVAPTSSTGKGIYYSNYTGTSRDPKLVITYTLTITTRSYVY